MLLLVAFNRRSIQKPSANRRLVFGKCRFPSDQHLRLRFCAIVRLYCLASSNQCGANSVTGLTPKCKRMSNILLCQNYRYKYVKEKRKHLPNKARYTTCALESCVITVAYDVSHCQICRVIA